MLVVNWVDILGVLGGEAVKLLGVLAAGGYTVEERG